MMVTRMSSSTKDLIIKLVAIGDRLVVFMAHQVRILLLNARRNVWWADAVPVCACLARNSVIAERILVCTQCVWIQLVRWPLDAPSVHKYRQSIRVRLPLQRMEHRDMQSLIGPRVRIRDSNNIRLLTFNLVPIHWLTIRMRMCILQTIMIRAILRTMALCKHPFLNALGVPFRMRVIH